MLKKNHRTHQAFVKFICFLIITLSHQAISHNAFMCEKTFPQNLQINALAHCNQKTINMPLGDLKSIDFDIASTSLVLSNNNAGAAILNLPNHTQKVIYRSANLAGSPQCIQELHQNRQVDTIINLIDTPIAHGSDLTSLEERIALKVGIENYIQIFNFSVSNADVQSNKFNQKIATIINYIVNSKGNVAIHCLVGAHNTGVIFGVLQKCYNKIPNATIETETLCHAGNPVSSFEKQETKKVINMIKDYPCDLLTNTI